MLAMKTSKRALSWIDPGGRRGEALASETEGIFSNIDSAPARHRLFCFSLMLTHSCPSCSASTNEDAETFSRSHVLFAFEATRDYRSGLYYHCAN